MSVGETKYAELKAERDLFAWRADQYASWTLPYLLVNPLRPVKAQEMQHDWQSVGSRGVVTLANKLMEVLFNPNRRFFKLDVNKKERALLKQTFNSDAQIDAMFAEIEKEMFVKFNDLYREKIIEVLQLLIISGDCVMHLTDTTPVIYNIWNYVREVSYDGELNWLILTDKVKSRNLPEGMRRKEDTEQTEFTMYTCIEREGNTAYYKVWQEIEGRGRVAKKGGRYHKSKLPWRSVYWQRTGRDNYGRGRVEETSGDFAQLSNLCESIAQLNTILAHILFLVNTESITSLETVKTAESGDYIIGRPEDISCVMTDVQVQIEALSAQRETLKRDIGSYFMMTTAITRDAERVTAEEIRQMVAELSSTLGGVYSKLATSLQQVLARHILDLVDSGLEKVDIAITTGLEALSRYAEAEAWKQLIMDLANANNIPQAASMWIKYNELIQILAASYGLSVTKVLKTHEEYMRDIKQQMEQQQQHEAALEQGKADAQTNKEK